jgi:hypothetical protein
MNDVITWELAYRLYSRGLNFYFPEKTYVDDDLREIASRLHDARVELISFSELFIKGYNKRQEELQAND